MESLIGEIFKFEVLKLFENIFPLRRYTKQNRPKLKKSKDVEKRQLLTPYNRASIPDISIDLQNMKRL